ncbi:MAG: ABC-2 family transporter protein [Patescibacteria group bacterium]
MFKYYTKIWLRLTLSAFQIALISRLSAFIFIFAKTLRFAFFIMIVYIVIGQTKSLAGYTLDQSLVFFLTFNVIDTLTQFLFRDVYRFRPQVISGYFDYVLLKPLNTLFKALLGGADPLDLFTLVPFLVILGIFISRISINPMMGILYILLFVNALLIATAFHIFVLSLGLMTTEIDHTIMIYRDLTSLARFPVDIYREPLRAFITFVLPIGVMMTFPPKALFGLLSPMAVIVAIAIGVGLLALSIAAWRFALTKYTSASS